MRLPRFRLRSLLIAVAVAAVIFAGLRRGPEDAGVVWGPFFILALFLFLLDVSGRSGRGGRRALQRAGEATLMALVVLALLARISGWLP